ncbi:MAG: FAD-dependent oxidoreductase, partial [Deltaproteobacteria bacterium]|nr:FAD-dependent oxidoreductase [Deltaproteobacteria bacterium]
CRIDGKEIDVEGGISIEDAKQTAVYAEKAGADAVHISAYGNPAKSAAFTKAPLVHEPCGFVDFAAAIKKCVNIPVITVGRIEPEQGDAAIKDGRADFVAMARKLIVEPNLPLKIMESSLDDIRPCIACYTCVGEIFQNKSLQCASNPIAGRESEFATDQTATKKRVLVIGGGPGGMEAARTAALCGHSVTLCDKGNKLGGTLFFASILEKDNGKLMDWLIRQIKKLPVDVRLETDITPEFVQSLNPD